MPRKSCNICEQRKPIEDFQKDKRNSSGYENRYRDCKNAQSRRKIKCPNCKQSYTRATLGTHMKTDKCVKGETEWKHPMPRNKRFKSNGQELVKCPCKHKACNGEVKEHTAYRHMRYGIDYKFPSQKFTSEFVSDDSDSERDL